MKQALHNVLFAFSFVIILALVAKCVAGAEVNEYRVQGDGMYDAFELSEFCMHGETTVFSSMCIGYIAGVHDSVNQGLSANQCPVKKEYDIDMLTKIVQWLMRTDPLATSPRSDAEMVVIKAMMYVRGCMDDDDNSRDPQVERSSYVNPTNG